jgi:hypothetical protein
MTSREKTAIETAIGLIRQGQPKSAISYLEKALAGMPDEVLETEHEKLELEFDPREEVEIPEVLLDAGRIQVIIDRQNQWEIDKDVYKLIEERMLGLVSNPLRTPQLAVQVVQNTLRTQVKAGKVRKKNA